MPQRACRRGAACCKQCIDKSAERTDRVSSRPSCLPGNVYLDRTNSSDVDGKIEIAIKLCDGRSQVLIHSSKLQPCHLNRTNLRQVDVSRAIDAQVLAEIDLAPDAHAQLVVRSNHI